METVIAAENLSFAYGDDVVFQNLSFTVKEGDFVVVEGPNGAGKSTLLKILLGLLPFSGGRISLFGKEGTVRELHLPVAYVSQKVGNFNTSFPATVAEVVESARVHPRRIWKILSKDDRIRVQDCLEHVGMERYEKSRIGALSGGQQQRVFIARALCENPRLLFLDEPTVGVDAKSVGEICELLHHLNTVHQITIFMVTHDPQSVESYANKRLLFGGTGVVMQENFQGKERKPC